MDVSQVVWRKSSHSGNGSDCVEIAVAGSAQAVAGFAQPAIEHKRDTERLFLVRDSKDPGGPVLALTPAEWEAFVADLKGGEFGDGLG